MQTIRKLSKQLIANDLHFQDKNKVKNRHRAKK